VKEAAALAPDKYFVTIPFAQSSAYCSQFLPNALYYNKLITGAKELKGKVTFAGIVILLGITERHGTQADINNYPQCMSTLVTAIRTDLGEPSLPLLLNDYEMGTTGPLAPTSAFAMTIRPKIQMVKSVVTNSFIIPTDNPLVQIQDDTSTDDDHHFSLDGHKEYARRVLQTMKDNAFFPW
jgi:Carbohydrate esterase, sialic acid-specific acetylesterase